MSYNTGLGVTRKSSTSSNGGGSSSDITYGRVVDIILDSFHPKYEQFGKSQAINGVLYRELNLTRNEDKVEDLKFAYAGTPTLKTLPLKGEIVQIVGAPAETNRDRNPSVKKNYYTGVVPLWNHPHHNAHPDTLQFKSDSPDFGKDFSEESTINPLQGFPGDTLIEGRFGQSIRFTGVKHPSSPWIDSSNNGKPLTIISNGQVDTDNGYETIVEDINKDFSSAYFTSDHIIKLEPSKTKFSTFGEFPTNVQVFKGSQILFNSDRIVLNSRKDDLLLLSNKNIALSGKVVGIDGEDYIGLDAKKIYLGASARILENEPVLLGQTTVDWLDEVIRQLEQISKTLATLPPAPAAAIPKLIVLGNTLLPTIKALKARTTTLNSKQVFTV